MFFIFALKAKFKVFKFEFSPQPSWTRAGTEKRKSLNFVS